MTQTRDDILSSSVRRQIVAHVAERPGELSAADLASLVGLHVTTIRFHVDQLVQAGKLEATAERRETVGRPRKVFRIVQDAVPVNDQAYVVLVDVLADLLPGDAGTRATAAESAGEAWARRMVPERLSPQPSQDGLPVRELVDVLARWGYARESVTIEEPTRGRYVLTLTGCPMAEAAARHPEVVCSAHRGLIRGTLTRLAGAEHHVDLRPMVADGICVAELRRAQS